jgi:hypothetical protein
MQEQSNSKKWEQNMSYKYRKAITLTKSEGETLDTILADHNCNNLSQLCKKIVKGELSLTKTDI